MAVTCPLLSEELVEEWKVEEGSLKEIERERDEGSLERENEIGRGEGWAQ